MIGMLFDKVALIDVHTFSTIQVSWNGQKVLCEFI